MEGKSPFNLLLIRPDENFRTYQVKGKNTNIATALDGESAGQRLSVRGTVIKLPERLYYSGPQLMHERKNFANDRSSVNVIQSLKDPSMVYDTPIEVQVGDIVFFSYLEHYECYIEGRFIEQEDHDLLLIKYDSLICCHKLNNLKTLKPLNGMILIEPLGEEEKKSTIETVTLNKYRDKIHKLAFASVILTGKKCNGYLEDLSAPKDTDEVKQGQIVMYKPHGAHIVEWGLHQVLFKGRRIMGLHRKNILMIN